LPISPTSPDNDLAGEEEEEDDEGGGGEHEAGEDGAPVGLVLAEEVGEADGMMYPLLVRKRTRETKKSFHSCTNWKNAARIKTEQVEDRRHGEAYRGVRPAME